MAVEMPIINITRNGLIPRQEQGKLLFESKDSPISCPNIIALGDAESEGEKKQQQQQQQQRQMSTFRLLISI